METCKELTASLPSYKVRRQGWQAGTGPRPCLAAGLWRPCPSLPRPCDTHTHSISSWPAPPARQTSTLRAVAEQLRWFAGPPIRNASGIGGNICTASPISGASLRACAAARGLSGPALHLPSARQPAAAPAPLCTSHASPCPAAADLNPIWMAAGAEFTVAGQGSGARTVPAKDFFLGYRRVDMQPHELLVKVGGGLLCENRALGGLPAPAPAGASRHKAHAPKRPWAGPVGRAKIIVLVCNLFGARPVGSPRHAARALPPPSGSTRCLPTTHPCNPVLPPRRCLCPSPASTST